MTRALLLLLASGCSLPVPALAEPLDVAELTPAVYSTTARGWCGALVTGARVALTPAHCAPLDTSHLDSGEPVRRGQCSLLQDWCELELERPRRRVAATRAPRPGEPVQVRLPGGQWGEARVDRVSQRWRAAWLDWPCERGDSGAVAWGADGAAVCMLTACSVQTGRTYCEELTP